MDMTQIVAMVKQMIKMPLQILHGIDFLGLFDWTGIDFGE